MVELAKPNVSSHELHMNQSHDFCSRTVSKLDLKQDESTGADRMKFVGKHSKDKMLSVYLQKRTIYEAEKDHKVEALSGLVRVSQYHAERILEKDHGMNI